MTWWQRVRRRWQLEDQLDAELRFHFDRLVADYMTDGCSEREARQKACAEFGGLEAIKDECRDARGTRWAHDLSHDARFAARLLAKDRAFTAVAVLALALGIGVNNTLFTIVNALCIRGLPIAEPSRMVDISERDQTHPFFLLTPRQFDVIESSRPAGLQSVAAYTSRPATLLDDRIAAETVTVAYVSPTALAAIGETPLLGRDFLTDDTRSGGPPVALISAGIWKTRYGSDPQIIGRIVSLNGVRTSIVGVMPDGFKFPDNADVWRPLSAVPLAPDARALRVYGRLASGPTRIPQVQDAVAGVLAHAPSAAPSSDRRVVAVAINSRFVGDITDPAWIAFITVGILLVVIACSNVATLLLARGAARGHEMAVRVSLGATRIRIVRQLLIESAMLAGLGGLAAIGVSFVGLTLLSAAMPPGSLPYWVTLTMDGRVAVMLVTVVLGTVLLFGLAPALQLSRTSPHAIVKQMGAGVTADRAHRRWTWIFLTAQLALTVILLAKLSVTLMQYYVLQTRDPAIDARHILSFAVTLPPEAYRTPDQRQEFFSRLAQRLTDSRGAQSVSVAGSLPFRPGPMRRIVPDTQAIVKTTPPVQTATVDAAFFDTLGVSVIEGRAFARDAATDRQAGIIVNQRLAQMLFPGRSAVGRRVRVESAGPAPAEEVRTIVGIVPAFRQQPTFQPDPLAYLPLSPEAMSTAAVLVRTDRDMGLLAGAIRDELRALDPNIPANRLMTLEQSRWEARWNARVSTEILTTVALVALALSTLGLAALTAYSVAQRRRELGIRLALGASAWQIVRLVLRRVLTQVSIGLAGGWLASIAWSGVFDEWGGNGPVNIGIVAIVLATVALAMSAWPALRASRIDPLFTLRQE